MNDLLTHLSDARPTDADLERLWSTQDRLAVLAAVRSETGRARVHHRSMRRTTTLAAAAAVAAAVGVPSVLGSGSAAAADLHALAARAASADETSLGEGQWLHETYTSVDRDLDGPDAGAVREDHDERWVRWDGRVLLIQHRPAAGWITYDVIDGSQPIDTADPVGAIVDRDPASYADPTPQFAATLPRDADGLVAYLDPRVTGGSSHDEALYSALIGLATSRMLPPRTLAATYDALAGIDEVTTSDSTLGGIPVIEVSFEEDATSSSETVLVDRASGQVLSLNQHSSQGDYTATTTSSEVIDQVPAEVVARFQAHEEGVHYPASVSTPTR